MKDNLLEQLQKPFEEKDLEIKVGALNENKTKGLALFYISARAIQNRLDTVLGIENWQVSYKEIQGGFLCKLSIKINNEWISKEDGAGLTEYESIKGGISNAFKRVASSGFGIGRYLYNASDKWYPVKSLNGKSYYFIELPKLELQTIKNNKQNSIQNTKDDPNLLKITFGKYKDKTLREIYNINKSYLEYLKNNSKDQELVNACCKLIIQ